MDGFRVRVHAGDGQDYLGEGVLVGTVTVFFIALAEGGLMSLDNAEKEPPASMIPEGGELVISEGNPKIVLDSGQVVYGCQVWWELCDESEWPEVNRRLGVGDKENA